MSEINALSGQRRPSIAAKRVASSVWILRPQPRWGATSAPELRAAFDHAISEGARDVVVELGSTAIDPSVVDVLRAMSAALLARDALLWLAAPWTRGGGHTLRPVRQSSAAALLGVSDALDQAISTYEERTWEIDGH